MLIHRGCVPRTPQHPTAKKDHSTLRPVADHPLHFIGNGSSVTTQVRQEPDTRPDEAPAAGFRQAVPAGRLPAAAAASAAAPGHHIKSHWRPCSQQRHGPFLVPCSEGSKFASTTCVAGRPTDVICTSIRARTTTTAAPAMCLRCRRCCRCCRRRHPCGAPAAAARLVEAAAPITAGRPSGTTASQLQVHCQGPAGSVLAGGRLIERSLLPFGGR